MRASCTARPNAWRMAALAASALAALALAACGGSGHPSAAVRGEHPRCPALQDLPGDRRDPVRAHRPRARARRSTATARWVGSRSRWTSRARSQRDSAGHLATDLTITLTAAAKTRTFGLDIVDGTIYVGRRRHLLRAARERASRPRRRNRREWPGGPLRLARHRSAQLADRSARRRDRDGRRRRHRPLHRGRRRAEAVRRPLGADHAATRGERPERAARASNVSSELQLVASAITSAQLDVYTGIADHVIRRVHVARRLQGAEHREQLRRRADRRLARLRRDADGS